MAKYVMAGHCWHGVLVPARLVSCGCAYLQMSSLPLLPHPWWRYVSKYCRGGVLLDSKRAVEQIVGPEPREAPFASRVIRTRCSAAPAPGHLNRYAAGWFVKKSYGRRDW